MTIITENTQELIKKFQHHSKDQGSSVVQIVAKTARIKSLTEHLKMHHKDKHSRRGIMQMVSMRKRHLKYLKKTSPKQYEELIAALGLRH